MKTMHREFPCLLCGLAERSASKKCIECLVMLAGGMSPLDVQRERWAAEGVEGLVHTVWGLLPEGARRMA